MTTPVPHPLDHVAWSSLTGPHAELATGVGRARRYRAELSPFAALSPERDERSWRDLRTAVTVGETVVVFGNTPLTGDPPVGWEVTFEGAGVQMIATDAVLGVSDSEIQLLGSDDVADMLELVARTQPGPFTARTRELGRYLGLRRAGRLVAMAGERMHPAGWTEISAVCTDPDARGEGLASRLVLAVAHGIRASGEVPFLHVAASNSGAIRLYTALGFIPRTTMVFSAVRAR